jgi:hypothetical protein
VAALQPSSPDLADRSILPSVPGVHAGIAVLIATVCTFLGVAVDATRGADLTRLFSVAYVRGCVLAVLLVRQRGLFTAAVQPPLLLFVAVPVAYQYMTKGGGSGLKDLMINDALPLVNRFPLMATATAAVLLIAGLRMLLRRAWTRSSRPRAERPPRPVAREAARPSRAGARSGRGLRSGSGRETGRKTSGNRTAKTTGKSGDTVKDKLDRIAAKADELKAEGARSGRARREPPGRDTPSRGLPDGAGYPDRPERDARPARRDAPQQPARGPAPYDPRYPQPDPSRRPQRPPDMSSGQYRYPDR